MGKFKEMRLKNKCKKEGRIEEYELYKKCIESLKLNIIMYRKTLNNAIEKFSNINQRAPKDSEEYKEAKDEVYRWKQVLEECELELKFIRPNSQKDIDYRNNQYENFSYQLQEVLSPDFDLRFHGTTIYFAEQIIASKTISSSADRYDGYIKSTDRKGEISVSNRETIGTTIHGWFLDLAAYRRSLPAGCIFALLPKDKEDATYAPNVIRSVDFVKNPEQLFGICTTPENLEQVKKWMQQAKMNPDLVHTFEEFLQVVKEKSKEVEENIKFSKRIKDINSKEQEIELRVESKKEERDKSVQERKSSGFTL